MKSLQNWTTTFQDQNGERQSHFLDLRDMIIHRQKHSLDDQRGRQDVKLRFVSKQNADFQELDIEKSLLVNCCRKRVQPIRFDEKIDAKLRVPKRSQSHVFHQDNVLMGVKITQTGINRAKHYLSLGPLQSLYIQNNSTSQPSTRNNKTSIVEPDKENQQYDFIKIKKVRKAPQIVDKEKNNKPHDFQLVSVKQHLSVKETKHQNFQIQDSKLFEKPPTSFRSRANSIRSKRKPQTKTEQLLQYIKDNEYIQAEFKLKNIDLQKAKNVLTKEDIQNFIQWTITQIELPMNNAYKGEEKLKTIKKNLDDQIIKRVNNEIEMEEAEKNHKKQKEEMFKYILNYQSQIREEYNSLPQKWNLQQFHSH